MTRKEIITQFAQAFLAGSSKYDAVHRGITLFYLFYVLLAERETEMGIREALMNLGIGPDPIAQAQNAKKILECYAAISKLVRHFSCRFTSQPL